MVSNILFFLTKNNVKNNCYTLSIEVFMCLFQLWLYTMWWRLAKKRGERNSHTIWSGSSFLPLFLYCFSFILVSFITNTVTTGQKKRGERNCHAFWHASSFLPFSFFLFFHIYFVILYITQFSYNINHHKLHVKVYDNILWLKQA